MVEHQSHPKKMENLNIIIEINEEGEMSDFDISLRNELPYKNTDEFEYVVEEFEKVKEVNHKKLRCLLAREVRLSPIVFLMLFSSPSITNLSFQLNCFACSAIYRFQLIFVRRRRKQFVLVNQRKRAADSALSHPMVKMLKTVSRTTPAPQNNGSQAVSSPMPARPDPSKLRQMLSTGSRTARVGPKTVVMAQNTVRGRQLPQNIVQHRMQRQQLMNEIGSSEEDIETEVIDSSMVEVQMETNSNSPQPSTLKSKQHQTPTSTQPKLIKAIKTEPVSSTPEMKYRPTSSIHDDNPLKCDLCHREFHSLRQRNRHRLTHLERSALLHCQKCDKPFVDMKEKEAHERTAHGMRKFDPGVRVKTEKGHESFNDDGDEGNEEVLMEIAVEEEVQDANIYVHDG